MYIYVYHTNLEGVQGFQKSPCSQIITFGIAAIRHLFLHLNHARGVTHTDAGGRLLSSGQGSGFLSGTRGDLAEDSHAGSRTGPASPPSSLSPPGYSSARGNTEFSPICHTSKVRPKKADIVIN